MATLQTLNVTSIDYDDHTSYLEKKYGITISAKIPEWWTEQDKKCWELLQKMFRYINRYKCVWFSKYRYTRETHLLHQVNEWQSSVVRWLDMKKGDRDQSLGLLVHKFKLQEIISECFKGEPGVPVLCNSIPVNFVEDRKNYLELYAALISELRGMVDEMPQ